VEKSCKENEILGIGDQNFNQKIEILSYKIEKKILVVSHFALGGKLLAKGLCTPRISRSKAPDIRCQIK
jgi:hypothetical protein